MFLPVQGDGSRAGDRDHQHVALRVDVLVGPCALRPREQGRVQVVGLEAPDRPGAVAREQVDDGLVAAPLRQCSAVRRSSGTTSWTSGKSSRSSRRTCSSSSVPSSDAAARSGRRATSARMRACWVTRGRASRAPALSCGEQREDELFLVAEVAADLAGEDARNRAEAAASSESFPSAAARRSSRADERGGGRARAARARGGASRGGWYAAA